MAWETGPFWEVNSAPAFLNDETIVFVNRAGRLQQRRQWCYGDAALNATLKITPRPINQHFKWTHAAVALSVLPGAANTFL